MKTETLPALVTKLKDHDQDFEFYPTTDAIIAAVVKDIGRGCHYRSREDYTGSILDIGAGNGKVLAALKKAYPHMELYAMEKSLILCAYLATFTFLIGTDLHEQTLLNKDIGMIFCNPPYSEFQRWSVKIIREAACSTVYLVIPERWKLMDDIKRAIAYREAKVQCLGSFSFEDAEDRKARAQVELLCITFDNEKDDAFTRFFNEQFPLLSQPPKEKDAEEPKKFMHLVVGKNYTESLVEMYQQEMAKIQRNYESAATLDADLLRELEVKPENIMRFLKDRLAGLRKLYWRELFDHMEEVTNRLCTVQRRRLMDILNKHGHVDFTVTNIQAVVMWVLHHSNNYIDEQLMQLFDDMVDQANVKTYKSNARVFTYDQWRYREEKPTHIALEYRLVIGGKGGANDGAEWQWKRGLDETAQDFLQDIRTVARNLGFTPCADSYLHDPRSWEPGKLYMFLCTTSDSSTTKVLMEVRAFKNRNIHIRLNQRFALALNVEHGRLRGWIHNAKEAAEELNDPQAAACFNSQLRIGPAMLKQLTG